MSKDDDGLSSSREMSLAEMRKDPRLVPYGESNLGMPLELVDGLLVPNERFFVRSNASTPLIDPRCWRLRVSGLVAREVTLALADLRRMPVRRVTAFLECAGNSRSRFMPTAEGTPWANDAVGNAVWEGTPLAGVLALSGVAPGAVEVVATGGDEPAMRRALPLAIAQDPETLLVWGMNGAELPVPHGGPVRLFVPGWAGIASTKWLAGLEVLDRAFDGPYNTVSYVIRDAAGRGLRPVREMPVKSLISQPVDGSRLTAGARLISGYAWSGEGAVTRVDVSVDGGVSWAEAALVAEAGRRSWVRFELPWEARPGVAQLRSRATDERGLTQPDEVAWNARGYLMNAVHKVNVEVSEEP